MAKFRGNELYLANEQKARFGDEQQANIWWQSDAPSPTSSGDLYIDSTISGVDPVYSYHLTTKQYVDDGLSTLSGSMVLDHGGLTGLGDDDHTQYILTDGSRGFTSTVSGVDPTQSYHLATKNYIDTEIDALSSGIVLDHGGLTGLGDDDHTQYTLADGTRAFTGTVGGITPTADNHLTTKQYVDLMVQGLDWQDSVLSFSLAASGIAVAGNRYIALDTAGNWTEDYVMEYNGTSWSGIAPTEGGATWVENEDALYVYNGSDWVKFGSTVTHNNTNGKQGGTTDEYYHLTSAEYLALTNNGGVEDASAYHIHDDRYFTEAEITTISGDIVAQIPSLTGYATETWVNNNFIDNSEMTTISGDIMSSISDGYVSNSEMTTISGNIVDQIITDHGGLTGLGDDDHTQYILADGSRGFTNTVSGVDPTQDYHLATKSYVDASGMDRKGRSGPITYKASQWAVNFTDLGHTNYTVNVTMQNITDSPPSVYAYIISSKTSSSFTVDFSGKMDSSNYYLEYMIIED